jgi:hypothetical protein
MAEPEPEKSEHRRIHRLENRYQWTTAVIVAALIVAALYFALGRGHQAETTTSDGRNVESPATANSGSAR